MVQRYEDPKIKEIFSDQKKLELWQATELAVMKARVILGLMDEDDYDKIADILLNTPIDLDWWKNRDKEIHHDLNAFIDERVRHLPKELHQHFHKNITSYDTEEPAFARSLYDATEVITLLVNNLTKTLARQAREYRYTIMNARTHGQEAEMQTFGAKNLTWYKEVQIADEAFVHSQDNLSYSKLSGAIGKYGSLEPAIEVEALKILDFIPFYGSTQIMPRVLYAPIAQSLGNLVAVIDKIGLDIRLAARSGRPILQEPFKKKQKGSSAMPHKKNTIRTEQLEGLLRMAKGYMNMITDNIITWEERAIEQSSVERVAWADLFHVTVQALKVLSGVLEGLKVYPDNMLQEIHESRGVYASSEVKEFLKTKLADSGLGHEDAYRIVQLACFNVFEPSPAKLFIRDSIARSFHEAFVLLRKTAQLPPEKIISIKDFIPAAKLRVSGDLDISPGQVDIYNQALKNLFSNKKIRLEWKTLFTPEFLLKNEAVLYREILGA
ncbi:MAG: lyase family protein [Candidatus Falkowbacteria bacterium]|nr:lyase family protein [Candidatus Falkowbacteria bacterium]